MTKPPWHLRSTTPRMGPKHDLDALLSRLNFQAEKRMLYWNATRQDEVPDSPKRSLKKRSTKTMCSTFLVYNHPSRRVWAKIRLFLCGRDFRVPGMQHGLQRATQIATLRKETKWYLLMFRMVKQGTTDGKGKNPLPFFNTCSNGHSGTKIPKIMFPDVAVLWGTFRSLLVDCDSAMMGYFQAQDLEMIGPKATLLHIHPRSCLELIYFQPPPF